MMELGKNVNIPKLERVRIFGIGAVGGFIATLAIAALIIVAETVMAFPRGFFYSIIGNAIVAGGTDAMNAGFYLHLLAGTLIGLVCASPIAAMKRIYIFMGDVEKRLIYGAIVGFVVWIFFFVPISYAEVAPIIEKFGDGILDASGKLIKTKEIADRFSTIVVSALAFHIQYGLIYAVITGSVIARRMKV